MVQRQQQDVVVAGEAQEAATHERSSCEVKGSPGFLHGQQPDVRLQVVLAACSEKFSRQPLCGQVHGLGLAHNLNRPAVDLRERRPQRLVSAHDFVQASRQRLEVERPL